MRRPRCKYMSKYVSKYINMKCCPPPPIVPRAEKAARSTLLVTYAASLSTSPSEVWAAGLTYCVQLYISIHVHTECT